MKINFISLAGFPLSIYNREMKSESGFSLAMASQPLKYNFSEIIFSSSDLSTLFVHL